MKHNMSPTCLMVEVFITGMIHGNTMYHKEGESHAPYRPYQTTSDGNKIEHVTTINEMKGVDEV